MNTSRIIRLVILFLLWPFHSVAAQYQLPDPREILTNAREAIANLQTVSYHAEYYHSGIRMIGDLVSFSTPIEGDVRISRTLENDPIGAKVFFDWKLIRSSVDKQSRAYTATYDGQKIRQLDPDNKIAYVNDPDEDALRLLIGGYTIGLHVFLTKEPFEEDHSIVPFEEELSRDDLQYDGVSVVGGVPCHIVYVPIHEEGEYTNLASESWWFIGIDDYIPRKWQMIYFENSGYSSMQVLTLTELKINEAIEPSAFVLKVPETYTVQVYEPRASRNPTIAVGKRAPNWTLTDANGESLSLRDLRGQVVVMDFWGTWCGPCLAAMPDVQKLHEQFGEQGVVVLGISTWENGDPAALMQDRGYTYRLLLNGDELVEDYGVNGIPTTVIIGQNGRVLYSQNGYLPDEHAKWSEIISEALAEE